MDQKTADQSNNFTY